MNHNRNRVSEHSESPALCKNAACKAYQLRFISPLFNLGLNLVSKIVFYSLCTVNGGAKG